MNKYLAEGIGAFFLSLIAVMEMNHGQAANAPLAVGATLAALSYAFGPLSGAHFNPAVSAGMLIQGRISRLDFPYYLLAQFLGGILAALMASFLIRCAGPADIPQRTVDPICALLAEFLGVFILTTVFLQTNVYPDHAGKHSYFGLAVGCALLAAMYAFGNLSGGLFNPTIFISAAITGAHDWGDFWVYFLGAFLGAASAASLFRTNGDIRLN